MYEQTGVALDCAAGGDASAIFFPAILFLRHALLPAKDGVLFDFAEWRRGSAFLWGSNGLLRKIIAAYGRCLSRNFTPGNITTRIILMNLIAITASTIKSSRPI